MSKSGGLSCQTPEGAVPGEFGNQDGGEWNWNTGIISLVRLRQEVRNARISVSYLIGDSCVKCRRKSII